MTTWRSLTGGPILAGDAGPIGEAAARQRAQDRAQENLDNATRAGRLPWPLAEEGFSLFLAAITRRNRPRRSQIFAENFFPSIAWAKTLVW